MRNSARCYHENRTGMKGRGSSVGRRKEIRKLSPEETQKKKKAILAALAKASEDYLPSPQAPAFSIASPMIITLYRGMR
ncbi:MAG: hypothetical protein A2Z15_08240 [Chloroflexi bacterium RBG_16_50_11]|nr:MAG: hypothetical protein A2Z15_08240 [Chloroflexi bacterium RBG_16_50_11]